MIAVIGLLWSITYQLGKVVGAKQVVSLVVDEILKDHVIIRKDYYNTRTNSITNRPSKFLDSRLRHRKALGCFVGS